MEEEEEMPEGGGEGGGDTGGGGEGGGDAEDSGDGGGEDAGRRGGEECDGLPVPAKLAPAKRYRQGSYLDDQYWKTCESNKANRAKVQFQQKTGSRSYIAHIYALNEERKGEPLSAIDYFKATHNSKTGYAEPVQKAIAEIEKRMVAPLQEGLEQKSATAIVAEVLTEQRPASTFLMNIGLQSSSARNKFRSDSVVAAQVTDLKEKLNSKAKQCVKSWHSSRKSLRKLRLPRPRETESMSSGLPVWR